MAGYQQERFGPEKNLDLYQNIWLDRGHFNVITVGITKKACNMHATAATIVAEMMLI